MPNINLHAAKVSALITLLLAHPGQSLRWYAAALKAESRQVQFWLNEMEVTFVYGDDPVTKRKRVKLWSVALPVAKQKALKVSA